MAYKRTHWIPKQTPLSAANFNNIEDGVEEALNRSRYLHCISLTGKSIDDEYDVYLDLRVYDNTEEPFDNNCINEVFNEDCELSGIVMKASAYLRVSSLVLQDDNIAVLFGDDEYGFLLGSFTLEDNVISILGGQLE